MNAVAATIPTPDTWSTEAFAAEGRARFKSISAAELDQTYYELKYVVDDVLVEGQPCIVAGPKKSLKTSVLLELALSIATGGCFLGKFPVASARRFLLCSGESGIATLQETARRIASAKGISLRGIPDDMFAVSSDLPRFDDHENLEEFESFLKGRGAEIVAIDPAYLCMAGDDAGNLFKQGALLRNVSEVCTRCGATLILAHHARKQSRGNINPYRPLDLDDIAWSGFPEFARQWILLGRREQYQPGSGNHHLWLSIGGSAGHGDLWEIDVEEGRRGDPGGRRWGVRVNRADEAAQRRSDSKAVQQQRRHDEDRAAVQGALAENPDGLSMSLLGRKAGISTGRWPKVFNQMREAGELVTCQVFTGNQRTPKVGYRLPELEPT